MKQLKSELAALDRKNTAELAPKHDEKDGEEVMQEEVNDKNSLTNTSSMVTDHPQGHKPSMVAEPQPRYPLPITPPRFPSRHAGI